MSIPAALGPSERILPLLIVSPTLIVVTGKTLFADSDISIMNVFKKFQAIGKIVKIGAWYVFRKNTYFRLPVFSILIPKPNMRCLSACILSGKVY